MREPVRLFPFAEDPPRHPECPIGEGISPGPPAEEGPEAASERDGSAERVAPWQDAIARAEPGERFHRVAPFGLPSESQHAAMLRLVDGIGLHLVCSEPRCRRAKRCRDPDPVQLPLCVWLHRGTIRFVLECLAGRAKAGDLPESPDPHPVQAEDSLLGGLRRAGYPIERLARTREDGADEWSWERHPEACALVNAFKPRAGTAP